MVGQVVATCSWTVVKKRSLSSLAVRKFMLIVRWRMDLRREPLHNRITTTMKKKRHVWKGFGQ